MFVNDETITHNGETINVRSESLSRLGNWIMDNPSQFAGRLSANSATVGVASFAMRGNIPASLALGGTLTTTSGVGAALNAIDAGIQDPVGILAAMGGEK